MKNYDKQMDIMDPSHYYKQYIHASREVLNWMYMYVEQFCFEYLYCDWALLRQSISPERLLEQVQIHQIVVVLNYWHPLGQAGSTLSCCNKYSYRVVIYLPEPLVQPQIPLLIQNYIEVAFSWLLLIINYQHPLKPVGLTVPVVIDGIS